MSKGFSTSLRNSFLHGEFDIDITNQKIKLHTYRSPRIIKQHELDEISFKEWTEYYMYSAFLNYCFILEKEKRRTNVISDFQTDEFLIIHPISKTAFKNRKIYYDESRTNFGFEKSNTPYTGSKISGNIPNMESNTSAEEPIISLNDLEGLEQIVGPAVSEVLDRVQRTSPNDYIAFLFDVAWHDDEKCFKPGISLEAVRFDFEGKYMAGFYFNKTLAPSLPALVKLQLEMLIYCHVWESKLLLKQLRTAIEIIEQKKVGWNYKVNDDRRLFIDQIVKRYKTKNLQLGKVVELAFHTSLRNAFAHSDYNIDSLNQKIKLNTYKPSEAWDIPDITFTEWTYKYILSVMIDLLFYKEKEDRRQNFSQVDLQQAISWMNQNLKP